MYVLEKDSCLFAVIDVESGGRQFPSCGNPSHSPSARQPVSPSARQPVSPSTRVVLPMIS
jgi:hypothetical protein